jgi:hypothetical protein
MSELMNMDEAQYLADRVAVIRFFTWEPRRR